MSMYCFLSPLWCSCHNPRAWPISWTGVPNWKRHKIDFVNLEIFWKNENIEEEEEEEEGKEEERKEVEKHKQEKY